MSRTFHLDFPNSPEVAERLGSFTVDQGRCFVWNWRGDLMDDVLLIVFAVTDIPPDVVIGRDDGGPITAGYFLAELRDEYAVEVRKP